VHEIVLVGGGAKIPKIGQAVAQYYNRGEPKKFPAVAESCAKGAAIQAAVLGNHMPRTFPEVLLLEPLGYSIGIETLGRDPSKPTAGPIVALHDPDSKEPQLGITTKIVESTTTIPTKKNVTFTTCRDNQTSVLIRVVEGERALVEDNRIVGMIFYVVDSSFSDSSRPPLLIG